jgi:hypothetical protein
MRSLLLYVVACLVMVLIAGCTQSGSEISRDDLKSELKIAQSYAAMANLLVGQHRQRATTTTFDSVHIHYLVDQVRSELTSLGKQRPSPELAASYATCIASFHALDSLGSSLEARPADSLVLGALAERTAALLPQLEQAIQSL